MVSAVSESQRINDTYVRAACVFYVPVPSSYNFILRAVCTTEVSCYGGVCVNYMWFRCSGSLVVRFLLLSAIPSL